MSYLIRKFKFETGINNLTNEVALGEATAADPSPASSCSITGMGLLTKSLDGFDVTPNNFVTGLITERGVCEANTESIKKLYKK